MRTLYIILYYFCGGSRGFIHWGWDGRLVVSIKPVLHLKRTNLPTKSKIIIIFFALNFLKLSNEWLS